MQGWSEVHLKYIFMPFGIISFGIMQKKELAIDASVINRPANLGSQQSSSASHNPPGDRYFIQLEGQIILDF